MKLDVSNADVGAFEPLPAGDYTCTILAAEIRETQAGNGQFINLELQTDNGRHTWDVLLFEHESEKAVQIGMARIRQLAEALEIDPRAVDPDLFVGRRVVAKIGIDRKDTSRNRVNGYKAAEAKANPGFQSMPVQPAQQAPQQAAASAPWKK